MRIEHALLQRRAHLWKDYKNMPKTNGSAGGGKGGEGGRGGGGGGEGHASERGSEGAGAAAAASGPLIFIAFYMAVVYFGGGRLGGQSRGSSSSSIRGPPIFIALLVPKFKC